MDRHDFCELIYVDNGKINVESENFKGILLQNQIIIHKANEGHRLYCNENTAPNVIIIGFECNCTKLNKFAHTPVTLSVNLQKILVETIKESRNVFMPPYDVPNLPDMKKYSNYPFGSDQLIKILLEYFLIKLIRESKFIKHTLPVSTHSNILIIEICSYIDKNFDQNHNIRELCLLFNTNKSTLCNLFKNYTGKTIIKYTNELKIKEAKRLMRESNKNFTQISEILNFNSVHYFCRLFTKIVKMTPSNYITTIKAKLS